MSRADSRSSIEDLLARIPDAVVRARASTPDVPGAILSVIAGQLDLLRAELS